MHTAAAGGGGGGAAGGGGEGVLTVADGVSDWEKTDGNCRAARGEDVLLRS